MKSRKKVEEINIAYSNLLHNHENKISASNFQKFKLPTGDSKKPPQTSQIKKRVDIFNNYDKILNNNFQEDFKCCYNLNINGTKLNIFKERKIPQVDENTVKLKKLKPKININFIVDSHFQSEESKDNSLSCDISSNEDLNLRKTFLTNVIKPIKEKPSFSNMMKTHYVGKEFEIFNKESSFDLKNFINEVSTAQQKIYDETEEIQKMLKYTRAAKDKLQSKIIENKTKSVSDTYFEHLKNVKNIKFVKNVNKKNLLSRNTMTNFYEMEKDKQKKFANLRSLNNNLSLTNSNKFSVNSKINEGNFFQYQNRVKKSNMNNLSTLISMGKLRSLPKI
jgi:hypothetical protein